MPSGFGSGGAGLPAVKAIASVVFITWMNVWPTVRTTGLPSLPKSRVRRRSGTDSHHVCDIPRNLLGIVAQDQVREHLFERTAGECGAKLVHGVVCDNPALMEHDDARAEPLDDVKDV